METKLITNPDNLFWQEFDNLSHNNFRHNVQLQSLWLKPYIEFLLKGDIYIIAVFQQNKLIGCLPLERNYPRATRFWNYRILSILGGGSIDFFEILTIPEDRKKILEHIFKFLHKHTKWDYIKLLLLPEDLVLKEVIIEVFKKHYELNFSSTTGYLYENTLGTWDKYYESVFIPKNKDLIKSERRLINDKIDYKIKTYHKDILVYFKSYVTLYSRRRKTLNQRNKYEDKDYWKFLKSILDNYEKKQLVELSVLYGDSEIPLAIQLDFINKNTRYHWNHAFNEAYKRYSPGKLLLKSLLKDGFKSSQMEQVNHMRGLSSYKNKLTSHKEDFYNIDIVNRFSVRRIITKWVSKILGLLK